MPTLDPIDSASLERIRIPVWYRVNQIVSDPTGGTVSVAFRQDAEKPAAGEYKVASWETSVEGNQSVYAALCLIGPSGGTITLTPGSWRVYVRVLLGGEDVRKFAGVLRVV